MTARGRHSRQIARDTDHPVIMTCINAGSFRGCLPPTREREVRVPFSREQFFEVFAAYNLSIWPAQVAAYAAGLAVLVLVFRPSRAATGATLLLLSLMWVVNGAGYHWLAFAEVNPAARIFAAVFVAQAIALARAAFGAPRFRIAAGGGYRTWAGLALALYALLIYPFLGALAGHEWPAVPVFGVAPCPTTVFTIGVLLLGEWRIARWLLVIPAAWGLVGGSAAVLLGVPQDYGLVLALLVVIGVAVTRVRQPDPAIRPGKAR